MITDDLNKLSGQIEGLARVVFHLAGRLEDSGLIDGPQLTQGLRQSIVLNDHSSLLMITAKETLDKAATALDEARQWRKYRQQIAQPAKRQPGRRKAA
jgi:hypothetical protein